MKKSSIKRNVVRFMGVGLVGIMVFAGSGFAGHGGNMGRGNTNGTGVAPTAADTTDIANQGNGVGGRGMGNPEERGIADIVLTDGTPFTCTGEVVAVNDPFSIDITTADGQTVTVNGIGPDEYWQTLTVARPAIGDSVTVTGYSVEVNGTVRNMAFTVQINGSGQVVEIRDAEGNPAWRQPLIDILSGTPFEYTGTVTTAESGFGTPMVITTDAGEEIAVRIGPPMYWDSLGATQPAVGVSVTVTGYALTVNDVKIYFAATVRTGETTVTLLDADGKPLWEGERGNLSGNGGRANAHQGTCL